MYCTATAGGTSKNTPMLPKSKTVCGGNYARANVEGSHTYTPMCIYRLALYQVR